MTVKIQFLVNRLNSQNKRLPGVKVDPLAFEMDFPNVALICPRNNFNKGRFTGTVFTAYTVDLTGIYVKRYVVQCPDTGEAFSNVFKP